MADHPPAGQKVHDSAMSDKSDPLVVLSALQETHSTASHDKSLPQATTVSRTDSENDVEKKPELDQLQNSLRRRSTAPLDVLTTIKQTETFHPMNWPLWKKWSITVVYCFLQLFVGLSTTTYVSVAHLIQDKFGGSTQVITLGQSMFVIGNAVGPVILGPLSDISGRKWIYVVSILLYAIFNIGTALAVNLPMLVVFTFLAGVAGSTALTNVAGTIADLFGDSDGAGQPMAFFVVSANFGPSLGSPIGEWIGDNVHLSWRWIYYLNIIIGGAFALGLCFIPETLPRVVISRAVKRRNSVGVDQHQASIAVGSADLNIFKEIRFVSTMALRIMLTEPIVIFLALYNGFAFGLLFLYLDGVFSVFAVNNHLSVIDADLSYLNFCVGVVLCFCFVPIQTYLYKRDRARNNGQGRPEARFITSLVAVWLFPISLFWFAFTSSGNVSYWSPIIAGTVLGFADPLLWIGMLNYITDSYPNVAASAIAAYLIPSFIIAAALCHAGVGLFVHMSTKWAFAMMGFISIGVVALVYVIFFFGAWLRGKSRLAVGGGNGAGTGTGSQLRKPEHSAPSMCE